VSTETRITELESKLAVAQAEIAVTQAEIAAITAELDGLKPRKAPAPPVDDQPGVRIMQIVEPSSFVRPTEKELRKLYDVVLARYPQLAPRLTARWADDERREHYDGYVWSFERCGYLGRLGAPDTRRYVNHWIAEAKDWLALHRPAHRGNIGAGFLHACLAHGDIPYTPGDENRGVVWAVGVTPYGGAKATDAWRRVLDGQLMAPTPPERRFA
jgi:hypothetical protein